MMPDLLTKLGLKNDSELAPEFTDNFGTESVHNSDGTGTELEQDPLPSLDLPDPPSSERASRASSKAPNRRATGQRPGRPSNLEKQVGEEISMYADILAAIWAVRDPVCGEVAVQQASAISAGITRILRRYPQAMARMHASGQVGDVVALLSACAPVGKAVWSHHITNHEEEDTDSDDAAGGSGLADRYPAFTGISRAGAVG